MLKRAYSQRLKQLLHRFPAVAILGPRQCGKTTFVRHELGGWEYFDLEKPSDAAAWEMDPEAALQRRRGGFVLDEAQRLPGLFAVLRGFIDERRKRMGQIVLLGSAAFSLRRNISESLAGRIGFLEMTPFSWEEVSRTRNVRLDGLWLRGGFPDAYLAKNQSARNDWFDGFTRTFVERDLNTLGVDVSSAQMRKIWLMLAHANGSGWNASQLAAALGTSYHTINRYVDILEQTFMVRKLQPYFRNLGKRMLKSPKVYLRDTGLLHYFLGLHTLEQLAHHPQRGASWEAFVVEQVVGLCRLHAPTMKPYYWRTARGAEVDLLLVDGAKIHPLEIKLHSAPRLNDVRGLQSCLADLSLKHGYVLYPGKREYSLGHGITALPVEHLLADPGRLSRL